MGQFEEGHNTNFASKGVAGTALGLGITGTVGTIGSLLSGNGFWGNGWGRNNGYNGAGFDITISEALSQRDAQIARLEAKAYSDESDLAIYKYFDGKIKAIDDRFHAMELEQCKINSTVNATLGVLGSQLNEARATLASITQMAIPESKVCNFDNCCGNG